MGKKVVNIQELLSGKSLQDAMYEMDLESGYCTVFSDQGFYSESAKIKAGWSGYSNLPPAKGVYVYYNSLPPQYRKSRWRQNLRRLYYWFLFWWIIVIVYLVLRGYVASRGG